MPTVRVRLFAALREIAGASIVEAEGTTVEEVVANLAARYGEPFAEIARAGSVILDGERAAADVLLAGSEDIALLPPVSGGALVTTRSEPAGEAQLRPAQQVVHRAVRRVDRGVDVGPR